MATIAPSTAGGSGVRNVTETTLTSSDTFVYRQGAGQQLQLRNVTGGALTVTITGADSVATTFPGGGSINYAGGYSTGSIAATTGHVIIPLDTISDYLRGTLTVTGGTGIKASIVSVS